MALLRFGLADKRLINAINHLGEEVADLKARVEALEDEGTGDGGGQQE